MKNKHKPIVIFAILSLVSLVIALVTTLFAFPKQTEDVRSQASGSVASISLEATSDVHIDRPFSLALYLDTNGLAISATDVTIFYDQGLELDKFELGDKFPTILRAGAIDTRVRKFTVTVGSGPQSPVRGKILLATLTFKAPQKSGNFVVRFDRTLTKAAALGSNTNVISAYTPLNITVNGSVAPPKLTIKVAQVGLHKKGVYTQADVGLAYLGSGATNEQEPKLVLYKTEMISDEKGIFTTKSPIILKGLDTFGTADVYIKTPFTLSKKIGTIDLGKTAMLDASHQRLVVGDFDQSSEQEKNVIRLTDVAAPLQEYKLLENQLTPETKKFDVDYNDVFDIRDISIILSSFTQLELYGETP